MHEPAARKERCGRDQNPSQSHIENAFGYKAVGNRVADNQTCRNSNQEHGREWQDRENARQKRCAQRTSSAPRQISCDCPDQKQRKNPKEMKPKNWSAAIQTQG